MYFENYKHCLAITKMHGELDECFPFNNALFVTWHFQAAQSVHHCVHRCAMHWRRITAKRVRQREGKPRPRPSIESMSERPVTSVDRNMNPVSSAQPAAYSVVVDRCLTVLYSGFCLRWSSILVNVLLMIASEAS